MGTNKQICESSPQKTQSFTQLTRENVVKSHFNLTQTKIQGEDKLLVICDNITNRSSGEGAAAISPGYIDRLLLLLLLL